MIHEGRQLTHGQLCRLAWRCLRIGLWMLLIATGISGVAGIAQDQNPAPVMLVEIDGIINPGAASVLQHALDTAAEAEAAALVIRIDTPGGMLSTTRDMVSAIGQSPVPVIGYIGPAGASATSAGAFLLLACDVAVMNAGTNVGASSPVAGDGGDIEGTMGKKVMNDSRAFMRSIAASRQRNADAAERMVSEARSFTAAEALEVNVIDLVVSDFGGLLPALDGREILVNGDIIALQTGSAQLQSIEPRLIDKVLKLVAHPQIAHMLLSLGMVAIYIEILSPGLALPGIIGAIAVLLGLVGVQALPVNMGFLMLLAVGFALLISEYFVAGFGVLGIGGAVAFTLGSLNLFDIAPAAAQQGTILTVSVGVSAAIVVSSLLIARSATRTLKKRPPAAGATGEAMVSFDNSGYVLVGEQRWPADTHEPLQHGEAIVVVGQNSKGHLLVQKQSANRPATDGAG